MKFMMIFEGVDRATKVMSKIMAAEKKTAAAVKAGAKASEAAAKGAARASEKQASALSKIGSAARGAFNSVVSGARAAGRAIATLHRQTIALGRAGLDQIGTGFSKAFRGLSLAAGVATIAFGMSALAANHLLDTATAFESYSIQLETLEGSAAKGQKAMAWITDFAINTPLELDQVVESYRNLKTFGLDPTNGTLQSLVDTMAASGKGAEQLEGLTLALGQAWTKGKLQGEEALQLLERGVPVWDILSKKYGKNAAALQEMASKGKLGREAIQYLIDEIGRRNSGASEKMARTWAGMVSNISDVWNQFKLAIMNAGLFDWMKGKLQMVLDTINRMKTDGTLDAWARSISNRIVMVLETAWQFATRTYEVLSKLGGYLQVAADYVGGWERLGLVLAGMAFAPILISTAAGLVQIAIGLSMLSAALMANPIVLLIAAIVAGAVAIYVYWEPIKAFFVDLWTSIAAGAAAAWAAVAEWLGFDPLAALSAGWSAISGRLSAVWDSLPSFEWSGLVPALTWSNFLVALDWLSWLSPLRWLDFVPGFSWSGTIKGGLDWASYVASIDWSAFLPPFSWGGVVTVLNWASWLSPLRWLDFIPGFSWSGIIKAGLDWASYVASIDWSAFLPPISWDGVVTVLNWASWLSPLRWLDFVPGFSWSGVISGALNWGSYIVRLDWTRFLPSFSWPALPAFSWPQLPTLELPELPDIAGWIGAFGDKALAALESVGAKLGSAWASVKSAFTFGDAEASVTVTDPATIRAAAEATARLSADMRTVAAIDTAPAMAKLSALDAAAAKVIHAMTGTIAGVRRALEAVGLNMQWTQWFQMSPPGPHDTHQVFVFADETIIVGEEAFSAANQAAARRLINATKRWSQDVAFSYGVRANGPTFVGALAQTSFTAVAHPFIFEPPTLKASVFIGATAATFLSATAHPEA